MFPRSVPYENSPPPRDNIVTVGMPGVTSTRSQMARYTGGDPVTVLRNWGDDPHDPLYELEKNNNRYSGMSMRHRLRRVWRLWKAVVLDCKGSKAEAEADRDSADEMADAHITAHERRRSNAASSSITIEGETATDVTQRRATSQQHPHELHEQLHGAVLNRRGKAADASQASYSEAEPPAPLEPALEAAARGLVDPPVLYRATCRVAPRLLHGLLASPEVAESRHRHWYRTLNPLHWALIAKELITGWWFCTRPFQFCYSEPGRSNMGGQRDQATYTREVRRAIHKIESDLSPASVSEQEPAASGAASGSREVVDPATLSSPSSSIAPSQQKKKKHLVLFGVSRGATTCFYTAMKLNAEDAKHVSLVLVEAPFDTLQHVIDSSSPVPRLLRWFFRAFCDWRGAEDEAAAYDFNPHEVHLRCPVAFVLSVKDRRVPNACTQALIDRVRRELVPHIIPAVEVLTLQHSRHPCMAVGHKEDQDAYVAFVEDLYNRYCSS